MISDGVTGYFKTVILSPRSDPQTRPSDLPAGSQGDGRDPAKCAYLGDNPIRDVEGTRAAGFGMMILFEEPATLAKEPQSGDLKPDYAIKETRQLLDIFPARA